MQASSESKGSRKGYIATAHWSVCNGVRTRKRRLCRAFARALFRTRTGDPLLTMEDSGCVYTRQETRFVACFPCKLAGFSPRSSLPLKDPEHPRESLNLSPKPVPNRARVRSLDGDERASPGSSLGRPSSVLLAPHQGARLALRADGVGEAKDTRGGERAQGVRRVARVVSGLRPAARARLGRVQGRGRQNSQ